MAGEVAAQTVRRLRLVVAVTAGAVSFAGCSSDESTTTAPTTAAEVSREGSALAADPSELSLRLAEIYPGVPGDKAADWAGYVCEYIAEPGHGDEIRYVIGRFSGGSRPDPTPAQAAELLDVIETTCPE